MQSCLRAWVLGSTFDNIIQQGNSGGGAIVALGACEDITMAFNVMTNLRHGGDADAAPFTDTGNVFGMCRRVKFIYNVVEKSINAAFECHAGNEDVEIGHNWFIGCQIGVLINNVSARVHHNHFKDCSSVAQIDNLTRQPGRYEFSDNKIIDSGGNAINAAVQIGQLASGPIVRSPAANAASIFRIDRNEWVGGNPTRLVFSNSYPAASPYYRTKFTGVSIQGNTGARRSARLVDGRLGRHVQPRRPRRRDHRQQLLQRCARLAGSHLRRPRDELHVRPQPGRHARASHRSPDRVRRGQGCAVTPAADPRPRSWSPLTGGTEHVLPGPDRRVRGHAWRPISHGTTNTLTPTSSSLWAP
jgi:hypothetical protein